MKRVFSKFNLELLFSVSRQRSSRILFILGLLYVILVGFEVPFVFKNGFGSITQENSFSSNYDLLNSNSKGFVLDSEENLEEKESPVRPIDRKVREFDKSPVSKLNLSRGIVDLSLDSGIFKSAKDAVEVGRNLWLDVELVSKNVSFSAGNENVVVNDSNVGKEVDKCPHSISLTGVEYSKNGKVMVLPCGLTLGSHITVVGKPRLAHKETETKISLLREGQFIMVSQFMMELQGLQTVEGEDPPRILHFNPRLKGDWSGKPVIEHNTCYRMQWGTSQRCEGWKSRADEETVDGQVKCEKWIRDNNFGSEKTRTTWWLNRLIGRTKKVAIDWPFPFAEDKLFVLTLSAGLEGYHINVDGRHVTSFPYRIGFTLEDATGLFLDGDIDVHSVFAASLPTSHPSFAPQRHLELSESLKAPPLQEGPVELFIGILSAGNHFAERMAVRKSWMQHDLIKSSKVIARFFVALHGRKEVNIEVKKEAEFFGDVVIVPYMDNYDLVVLKTVAICEYGVRTVSAKYIMKGDDDTFVRVDAIIDEAHKVSSSTNRSLYIGNINYYHRPLRSGKWAVTYEEWPEEAYPPYANGPGYIISSDIANFIVSDFENHNLRLFKMEDVSMGMWVVKVNSTRPVEYVHSLKYCQFGCIEDYITAHYQSPRQMLCLWNRLQYQGRPSCCNMR